MSIPNDLDIEQRSKSIQQGSLKGLDPPSVNTSRPSSESESSEFFCQIYYQIIWHFVMKQLLISTLDWKAVKILLHGHWFQRELKLCGQLCLTNKVTFQKSFKLLRIFMTVFYKAPRIPQHRHIKLEFKTVTVLMDNI